MRNINLHESCEAYARSGFDDGESRICSRLAQPVVSAKKSPALRPVAAPNQRRRQLQAVRRPQSVLMNQNLCPVPDLIHGDSHIPAAAKWSHKPLLSANARVRPALKAGLRNFVEAVQAYMRPFLEVERHLAGHRSRRHKVRSRKRRQEVVQRILVGQVDDGDRRRQRSFIGFLPAQQIVLAER